MNFNYNLPIKFNIPAVSFRSKGTIQNPGNKTVVDGFSTNPLYDKLSSKAEIELSINTNPKIKQILSEHNIPLEINIKELENLKQGHLKTTRLIAAQIYSSLPNEVKKEINLAELQEAAMLHDYGKILIPDSILNKKGKLTPEEKEIMELHSELSYELLKNKGISEKTLNLIKYHHQNPIKTGYPKADKDFDYGIDSQILSAADKYTALREKRSYKNPMGKYEALEIIAKDVNDGLISQDVFTALTKIT